MRNTLPTLLAAAVTSVLVACAHEEPLPSPDAMPPEANSVPQGGRFVLTGIRQPIVALITEQGIQGPDVNLGRFPGENGATGWRGTAFGRDVNLRVTPDGADGIVGRAPFNLQTTKQPDGMLVNGLIGSPSTVTISRSRINGAFGRCGYDLRFQGQAYVGPRSCGGNIMQVGVTLPPILNTWPDAEVAVALALLMSGR